LLGFLKGCGGRLVRSLTLYCEGYGFESPLLRLCWSGTLRKFFTQKIALHHYFFSLWTVAFYKWVVHRNNNNIEVFIIIVESELGGNNLNHDLKFYRT